MKRDVVAAENPRSLIGGFIESNIERLTPLERDAEKV